MTSLDFGKINMLIKSYSERLSQKIIVSLQHSLWKATPRQEEKAEFENKTQRFRHHRYASRTRISHPPVRKVSATLSFVEAFPCSPAPGPSQPWAQCPGYWYFWAYKTCQTIGKIHCLKNTKRKHYNWKEFRFNYISIVLVANTMRSSADRGA